MLLRLAIYCTFGKGKVSRLRHGQQCGKGNFLTWSELQIQSRHLGLSPEMDTWYIDIYIYIVFVWGGWWQHGKLTSSYDLPAGNQSTRWGCLRVRFENVAPGMIKHIETIESWQYFKVSLCKWCFCMSFMWFSTLNMFFFWIPNPSTWSEPQHVCFKRSKQHLLDFTTASTEPRDNPESHMVLVPNDDGIVMFHLAFIHIFFVKCTSTVLHISLDF